ncbi:MAG TPA: S8 family serine peptidase [Longimicrobiales bacterium]
MIRSSLFPIVVAAAVLASCVDDPAQPQNNVKPQLAQVEDGRYILTLNGNTLDGLTAGVAALGGTIEFAHLEAGVATVSGLSEATAAKLATYAGVGDAYRDIDLQLNTEPEVMDANAEMSEIASPANPTTAVRYSFQWNMRRIQANTAWAIPGGGGLGSPDVKVAILDSGIDPENLDMAGRIDMVNSRSFVASDDAFMNTWLPARPKFDDLNGHGTNVATQVSSNSIYLAGVNSRTTLLAVKVIGRTGSGSTSSILNGLIYAADQDADVANMSLGVPRGFDKAGNGRLLGIINQVFNYAHRKGMVIVVSAGNDTINMTGAGRIHTAYCESPHVICVAATGPTSSTNAFAGPWVNEDALAGYSNFGDKLTVAAPGGTNRGWVPSVCARRRVTGFLPATPPAQPQPVFGCLTATPNSAVIVGYAGTSQASPHVAGLVAKLVERYGKNNPDAIRDALINTSVDDLGTAGFDNIYGWGRINVARALGL